LSSFERVLSFVSAIAFRHAKESTDADTMTTGSREPMREVLKSNGATGVKTPYGSVVLPRVKAGIG